MLVATTLAITSTDQAVLGTHLFAAVAMAGVIWTMQFVHYPLFALVGPDDAARYQQRHMRAITYVVTPLMVVQGLLVWVLFIWPPDGVGRWLITVSGVAQAVALVWTAGYFAPLHGRLAAEGYSVEAVRRLVMANWVRSAAWTVSAVAAVVMLAVAD